MRVFVSSTLEDLRLYREAAIRAIYALGGYGDDCIMWSADERDPATLSIDRARQCDVLVLILAHRYGYVPAGGRVSVTELEYQAARDAKIPVLAFFIDPAVPWPPSDIDWNNHDRLGKFKEKVRTEVTSRQFASSDELLALITQALVSLIQRTTGMAVPEERIPTRSILVDPVPQLLNRPDLVLEIGESEDGLALLLEISRRKNLDLHLESITQLVSPQGTEAPKGLIESFRHALEEHAMKNWTRYQVHSVQIDGDARQMFVSKRNLMQLSSSLLYRIFSGSRRTAAPSPKTARPPITAASVVAVDPNSHEDARAELQSAGGLNRFLGVDIADGKVYSVGWRDKEYVVWRPFIFESISSSFSEARYAIECQGQELTVDCMSYPATLRKLAGWAIDGYGNIQASVSLLLRRQAVAVLIIRIARALEQLHSQGALHGDLKPSNVLLSTKGPSLIDQFQIREGSSAPGWTPGWSAPEQVMNKCLTTAADIYPLGLMLVELLGGSLAGEVRKFRIPPLPDGRTECDVFSNPSVYLSNGEEIIDGNPREWLSLIGACLRFEPDKRISTAAEFAEKLDGLVKNHPLRGEFITDILDSRLVVARMLDGRPHVARMLADNSELTVEGLGAVAAIW